MVRKFTRLELYNLVWSKPMTTLAHEFNISDNGLRKICKKNDIPLPKQGHWAKVKFGYNTINVQLPKQKNSIEELIEINVDNDKKSYLVNSPGSIESIINNKKLNLTVAKRLSTMNKLIIDAQSHLKTERKSWNQATEITYTQKGFIDLVVAPGNLSRALRIYDCLIKNLETLNYTIQCDFSKTQVISFDNHKVKISLREKYSIVQSIDKHGWKNRDFIPNGTLSIKIDGFGLSEFKDTEQKPLEDQILKIISKIEFRIKEIRDYRAMQEEQKREKARIEEINRITQKLKDDELDKFRNFFNSAHRWKKHIVLKEYYDMVCFEIEKGNVIKDKEWLNWAKEKLDWYNPLLDSTDPILSNNDKDLY